MKTAAQRQTVVAEDEDDVVLRELKRIAGNNDGILRARDVVDDARPPTSPLHSRFDWDDSIAAEKWRLEQAGQLIRICVEYFPVGNKTRTVRAFVSMMGDRHQEGGGYRSTLVVLSDKRWRATLLKEALAELSVFQKKYSHLDELAAVFAAARQVRVHR